MEQKTALVAGAGGFIGSHMVKRLKEEGYWVRGVDLKKPDFSPSVADEFIIGDLRDPVVCKAVLDQPFDRVYQLAADMGGAGYVFSGEHDADIMYNSGLINLNMVEQIYKSGSKLMFFSSSACVYPTRNLLDPNNPLCSEESAYPAAPGNEYGWEKLFSERLYLNYMKNKGLNVRIARFHTMFGPEGTWQGGKEKFPAAVSRKVAEEPEGGEVEVWGDGKQTRSFTYIDECIEGIQRLMASDFVGPVNIGSEEMLSINEITEMVIGISGKKLTIKNVEGFVGARGRNSDNALIKEKLGWAPSQKLIDGLKITYKWVEDQVKKNPL